MLNLMARLSVSCSFLCDYAFTRTTSKGTTLIHANGQKVAEENRELFVLQKKKQMDNGKLAVLCLTK